MFFAEVVDLSEQVAATPSRLAKRDLVATLLARVPTEEIVIASAYLSGVMVQRRTGVGWRSLADLPPPAAEPTASLLEIDAVLTEVADLAGPGSSARRQSLIAALFSRLTRAEQQHLRALLTGGLRQGAQDSVVLEAIAVAAGVPVAAVRRAAMFSAPSGPVALAALTGGTSALARFTLSVGRPVRPMLAASAPDVAAAVAKIGDRCIVDAKLDGIRIQVHKHDDEVLVFTRSLDEIGERLPAVVAATRALPAGSLILDGEAMSLDDHGLPRPFQETASWTASRAGSRQIRPFFFDLLSHDDEDLIERPLHARLERLDAVVPPELRIPRLAGVGAAEATAFFDRTVAGGQEGVIVKDPMAPYAAGRRGAAWVKVKPRHTLDLVVLAVEHGSGRRRGTLSNIHLGARAPDGSFVMLGKTFKGLTDATLAWQTERFGALAIEDDGHVVTVRPEQVVEIAFDGVQRSTRYPGGVALRFARVIGYRDDKAAAEADTLDAVRAFLG